MKIKGVDFPEPLLNALRDGRLVVFAGAGVSMGPPAGLPDFRRLAEQVAEGTVQPSKTKSETDDQFLGRPQGWKGQESHHKLPCSNSPAPAPVYRGLLQLFPATNPGRIITTRFHCLLERETGAECKMNQSVQTPYAPPRRPQRCKQYQRQAQEERHEDPRR